MRNDYCSLLAQQNHTPVLVDIGASGEPPQIWETIAPFSIYVGFDPDLRDIHEPTENMFRRAIIVNEAVVAEEEKRSVDFYLTSSPYCSSTLPPDSASLGNYRFAGLFEVENTATVKAATLNSVLARLELDRIDWLKIDSQGTDLRLFQSLHEPVRKNVLALDVEPGLIDAYQGEDLLMETHRVLTKDGFWLSSLDVKGELRIRARSYEAIGKQDPTLKTVIDNNLRMSPIYGEARYLRTLEWLEATKASSREYTLLWEFAMIDGQYGYALDIADDYAVRFAAEAKNLMLREVTLQHLRKCEMVRRRRLAITRPARIARRLALNLFGTR